MVHLDLLWLSVMVEGGLVWYNNEFIEEVEEETKF